MSTSLAEQLRRLAAPQTSILVDSKKRPSILFDPKEAANKDRKTIYDLGRTGLMELIKMRSTFAKFEKTLFDEASLKFERSVESESTNKLIDKNIRKFLFQLSPYFMLQPAHLCLEWLIRRFHIHEYNKNDFIGLILPYHETKIFVKCVQLFDLNDPSDLWKWLKSIQGPGVPLSKTVILNRAANDTAFLRFVCDYTKSAIKELNTNANTLQTQINFFYTTVIGGLEYAKEITDSHILIILSSVLKGLASNVIDYTAAALMITMQLCCKTKLIKKLLDVLIEKISRIDYVSMQTDIILALIIIYDRQSENLNIFPEEHLIEFITKPWIIMTMVKLMDESIAIKSICCPIIATCLMCIQKRNEGSNDCKKFLESLLSEIRFNDDDVNHIIRTVLDNYQKNESPKRKLSESNIIEIDSENDDDDQIMTEIGIKKWYSHYLQQLENQYPIQFDNIIKKIMQDDISISKSRKKALKTVLSFHLKSSYFKDNTSIYENLYHHNPRNRIDGIKYLMKNFSSLNLSGDNLLKDTIKDRLNDDDPNVVKEILNLPSDQLIHIINNTDLVDILIEILCKCQSIHNWERLIPLTLKHLTCKIVYNGTDYNRILLAIVPFLITINTHEFIYAKIIFESNFSNELQLLRTIVMEINSLSEQSAEEINKKVIHILQTTKHLPNSKNFLQSFPDLKNDNNIEHFLKLYNFSYFLMLLEESCTSDVTVDSSLEIIEILMKLITKINFYIEKDNDELLKSIRKNKVPLNIFISLLKTIINNIKFDITLKHFDMNEKSNQIFLRIYEFLLMNSFTKSIKNGKLEYENALKSILDLAFKTKQDKLEFLSYFFVIDRIPNNKNFYNIELQLRSINLFYHILNSSSSISDDQTDKYYKIDSNIFIRILIGLSSKIELLREFITTKIFEILLRIDDNNTTLEKSRILDDSYKLFIRKILQHTEEIQMHNEHISFVLLLIEKVKKQKDQQQHENDDNFNEHMKYILNQFLNFIMDDNNQICLKAELIEILTHLNDLSIFKTILILGISILQKYEKQLKINNNDLLILDQSESKIYKLITLRYNDNETIKLLNDNQNSWIFIEKSLKLYKILLWVNENNDNDNTIEKKFVTITSFIIENFNDTIYNKIPDKYKKEFFELFISAVTLNDKDNVLIINGKKFMKHIQLDCKYVIQILEKMKNICCDDHQNNININTGTTSRKRNEVIRRYIAPEPHILNSLEWKKGITLLEFLQNKRKLQNYKILISTLFDILKECCNYEEQFNLEYIKQLILSCLLLLSQKLLENNSTDSINVLNDINSTITIENLFKIDLIIQCIRGTQNSQTHHHALLLLSNCATIMPQQVLHYLMSLFTFMGSSIVRHDDSFSFQIISNIIESIIPQLIKANTKLSDSNAEEVKEELVISVLKVFADIILDVPEHRRLPLYTKLIRTLGPSKYLWMFLCLTFESHVLHSSDNKKKKDTIMIRSSIQNNKFSTSNIGGIDELPKRIEIALQIIKNFEPSITIETCTKLFGYLKELPFDKVDNDHSNDKMEIDVTDNDTLFNVNTYTAKQLRHYKYVIVQFINSYLTSTDFINQIALFNDDEQLSMKSYYQDFIIKILNYIPQIIKPLDNQLIDSAQIKYWKIILHYCYDILDSAISLLTPDLLLIVINGLMEHQLLSIRRKMIDILINKLQHKSDYFQNCNENNLLMLLEPLQDNIDTILNKNLINNAGPLSISSSSSNNELIYIQQSSLIAIKILSKFLSTKYPEKFKDILHKLINILKKQQHINGISKILLATLILTITEIIGNLRAHSIVYLPKCIPIIIEYLNEQSKLLTQQPPDNITIALITGAQKIFEILPLFLGPYLNDLLFVLIKIWINCIKYYKNEQKSQIIVTKLNSIWSKISSIIQLRVLMPNFHKIYAKLLNEPEYYEGIEYLMKLLKDCFTNTSGNDIQMIMNDITELFLNVLEFRIQIQKDQNNDKVNMTIENFIIEAFVALTLKLSEGSFRPLYHKLYDWSFNSIDATDLEDELLKEKSITYFSLSNKIAESLQSLFVLFASDFIQKSAELLDNCNPIKMTDKKQKLYFPESSRKNQILIENILRTLHLVFLYDSKGFINAYRFDILMQSIVDQLENPLIVSDKCKMIKMTTNKDDDMDTNTDTLTTANQNNLIGSDNSDDDIDIDNKIDTLIIANQNNLQKLLLSTLSQLAVSVNNDTLWKQLNYQILLKTRNNNPNIRILSFNCCIEIAKKLGEDFNPLLPETIPFIAELFEDEVEYVEKSCKNGVQELENILGESIQKYF